MCSPYWSGHLHLQRGKLRPEKERNLLNATQRPLTIEEPAPRSPVPISSYTALLLASSWGSLFTSTPPCCSSCYQHVLSSTSSSHCPGLEGNWLIRTQEDFHLSDSAASFGFLPFFFFFLKLTVIQASCTLNPSMPALKAVVRTDAEFIVS